MKTVKVVEITEGLSQLVGMRVSGVKIDKEGFLTLGFGRLYKLSNIVMKENGIRIKNDCVSEYELKIQADIIIFSPELSHKKIYAASGFESIRNCKAWMMDSMIEKIEIMPGDAIQISTQTWAINILYNSDNTESWSLCQPGTEADQYIGYKTCHLKKFRLQKRWSYNHILNRDNWHSIISDGYREKASLDLLYALKGAKITYGLKSADMNFFDIGFQQKYHSNQNASKKFVLHIMCSFSVLTIDNRKLTFFGDTRKETFEEFFTALIEDEIEDVCLKQENELCLKLAKHTIQIIPADDGAESWRLFDPISSNPHLVASNMWINTN